MKKLFGMLSLAIVVLLSSCDIDDIITVRGEGPLQSFTVETDAIDGVLLDLSAKVIIKKGDTQSVVVTAQANIFDVLSFENNNGVLEIDNEATILNPEPITIELTVPSMRYVFNDSSGDIVFEDYFNEDVLKLTTDASGDIIAKADTREAEVTIDGSGNIELMGSGEALSLIIDGSGDFKGFGFEVLTANVLVDGSGESEILVVNDLSVSIDGAGDVFYKGSPAVTVLDNGSGSVVDAN